MELLSMKLHTLIFFQTLCFLHNPLSNMSARMRRADRKWVMNIDDCDVPAAYFVTIQSLFSHKLKMKNMKEDTKIYRLRIHFEWIILLWEKKMHYNLYQNITLQLPASTNQRTHYKYSVLVYSGVSGRVIIIASTYSHLVNETWTCKGSRT